MYRYGNRAIIILVALMFLGSLYACAAEGYAAMNTELSKYEALRQERAEQSALIKLQHPMQWSSPEAINATVWQLNQESDVIAQGAKQ